VPRSGFKTSVRRIRVVNRERSRWAFLWGLWLPALLVLVGFFIWRMVSVSGKPEVEVSPRPLSEITLTWSCDAGHVFEAPGQIAPRACPTCGGPAFPSADLSCPTHGVFRAQLMFEASPADPGRPRYGQYRVAGTAWCSLEKGVACPRCGAWCRWRSVDPLYRGR
jgi:hypothetical protein